MSRRVLCVEDDAAIAELLHEVLTEEGFLVDLAGDGTEGARLLTTGPDVVVCDIDLPGPSGLDLLRTARAGGSRIPFVVLTAFAGRENQIAARRLGCDDFVTKPIDFDLLLAVLHNVLQRGGPGLEGAEPRLTQREREVIGWVARGKSSAEIAAIAGISERTVNFHVDRVLRKLGVATRTQAAVACVRLGLVPS